MIADPAVATRGDRSGGSIPKTDLDQHDAQAQSLHEMDRALDANGGLIVPSLEFPPRAIGNGGNLLW